MAIDETLRQGIAAVNAGHKAEARRILMQVVQQDERNEMAWLWLSGAVDTNEERRICLENVLAINPNNRPARQGLEHLLASKDLQSLSALRSSSPDVDIAVALDERPEQVPSSALDETACQKSKPRSEKNEATRKQTNLMVGVGVAALVLVCVTIAGAWWVFDSGFLQSGLAAPMAVDSTQVSTDIDVASTPIPTPIPFATGIAADYALDISDLPSIYEIVPGGTAILPPGNSTDSYMVSFMSKDLSSLTDPAVVINVISIYRTADEATGLPLELAREQAVVTGHSVQEITVNGFADEVAAFKYVPNGFEDLPLALPTVA